MPLPLLRVYAPEECRKDGYPFPWNKCPRCEGHGWLATATDQGHPAGSCRKPIVTATMDLDGFEATCCDSLDGCPLCKTAGSVKNLVRQQADHRCVRCCHPFRVGESGEMEGPAAEAKAVAADMGLSVEMFDQMVLENGAEHILPPEKELKVLEGARRVNWSDCDEQCCHGGPIRTLNSYGLPWLEIAELKEGRTAADVLRETLSEHRGAKGSLVQAAWRILTVHHLDEVKANLLWWNLVGLCQRCHLEIQGKVAMNRPWPWEHSEWMKPYVAGFYAMKYRGEELSREETMERLDELLELGHREESTERMAL